jgi:hypothetical protein
MGKDREGKFHPRKGKPSSNSREGIGLQPVDTSAIEEQLEIAEKYTDGEDQPAPNLHIRHRNRNVDKREERGRTKDAQRFNNPANKTLNETSVLEPGSTDPEELPPMLTKEQFAGIANYSNACCVSLYMPTTVSTSVESNKQRDFIGFKNKLQQLTISLKEKGIQQSQIDRLLKPGYDLLRNEIFWTNLSDGLAVFMADDYFKYIRLPVSPREEVLINSTFYMTPLIPVMMSKDYFYVLVLSKKQAKFYRADAFGMHYVPIPEMPQGVEDVVHFEEKGGKDLFRTDTAGAGSGANYHGIGTGRPDPKTDLAMYFDEVDETLWKEILNKENVPLLLAGVEYLIPIYKQVAKYRPIWEDSITGNHEHENIGELYQQARAKMEPYFNERIAKALNLYANQSATELTSSIPDDIIPAAHYGRVSHLFALKGEHLWGSFDEMNNALEIHPTQEAGDECLVDKAIIRTLLTGGEVFILPEEKMPAGSKLAAVMRY